MSYTSPDVLMQMLDSHWLCVHDNTHHISHFQGKPKYTQVRKGEILNKWKGNVAETNLHQFIISKSSLLPLKPYTKSYISLCCLNFSLLSFWGPHQLHPNRTSSVFLFLLNPFALHTFVLWVIHSPCQRNLIQYALAINPYEFSTHSFLTLCLLLPCRF